MIVTHLQTLLRAKVVCAKDDVHLLSHLAECIFRHLRGDLQNGIKKRFAEFWVQG